MAVLQLHFFIGADRCAAAVALLIVEVCVCAAIFIGVGVGPVNRARVCFLLSSCTFELQILFVLIHRNC